MNRKRWTNEELKHISELINEDVSSKANAYHIYEILRADPKYIGIQLQQVYNAVLQAKRYLDKAHQESLPISAIYLTSIIEILDYVYDKDNRWYALQELHDMLSSDARNKLGNLPTGQIHILGRLLSNIGCQKKKASYGKLYYIDKVQLKIFLINQGVYSPSDNHKIKPPHELTPKDTQIKLINIEDVDWGVLKARKMVIKAKSMTEFLKKVDGMKQTIYYDTEKAFYNKDGILFACEATEEELEQLVQQYT